MNYHVPKYLLLILIVFLVGVQTTNARKLISASRFGKVSFINPPGWTFTGVNMNISLISPSTGYPGASGHANLSEGSQVSFTNTSGNYMPASQVGTSTATLLISTLNYTNIRLSFAMRKSSKNIANLSTYKLEWSADSINYYPVTFTVSSGTDWNLAKGAGLTLPLGAENQASLYLKWTFVRKSPNTTLKIDDFLVKGDSVCAPISILTEPVNPFPICVNSGVAVFETTASGTGINYQWQQDSVDIIDDTVFSGTQSYKLIITNPPYALNGKKFCCIVSNYCGGGYSSTSKEAELTIQTLSSDINKDGNADNNDFIIFVQNYNTTCTGCPEDINNDGFVNIFDFLILLYQYNQTCH